MQILNTVLVIGGLTLSLSLPADARRVSAGSKAAGADLPTVEITAVMVDPTDVRAPVGSDVAVATVTVRLLHQNVRSPQHVTVEVGTYSVDPPEAASVRYSPDDQVVTFAGVGGAVTATVRVVRPEVRITGTATLKLTATLRFPSRGIRIVNNDPGLPNNLAVLKISHVSARTL
jgi:hypothetical protein